MTGNPYFSSPFVGLSLVTSAVDELEAAWQASQEVDSSKDDTTLVRTRAFTVTTLVNALAAYVEYIANNDHNNAETIIFSANMGVKEFPSHTGRVFEVRNLPVSGNVLATTRSEGRASYEWEYNADPSDPTGWVPVPSTSVANTIILGLTPGSRIHFRMRVNKGTSIGPWQGPVNLIIT